MILFTMLFRRMTVTFFVVLWLIRPNAYVLGIAWGCLSGIFLLLYVRRMISWWTMSVTIVLLLWRWIRFFFVAEYLWSPRQWVVTKIPDQYVGTWLITEVRKGDTYSLMIAWQTWKRPDHSYFFRNKQTDREVGDELFIQWYVDPVVPLITLWFRETPERWQIADQWKQFVQSWFTFNSRMQTKWYAWSLFAISSVLVDRHHMWWFVSIKRNLIDFVEQAFSDSQHASLLLWILIGDVSQMSQGNYDEFVRSGLVHLVAVSGGNIIFVLVILQCILFWLPIKVRTVVMLWAIVVYCLLVGLDASVARAMVMWLVGMSVLLFGWYVSLWRIIVMTWCWLLLRHPLQLFYDPWFLLSFSALVWIVAMQPSTSSPIVRAIMPTIGASIGVLPISLFYFGLFNIVSLLANIILLPIMGLILMVWLLIVVLVWVWIPARYMVWIGELLLELPYYVASLWSRFAVTISFTNWQLFVVFVMLLVMLQIFSVYQRRQW